MSSLPKMKSITVKAPVNIAVIKYWGKLDEVLIIPLNDSLSGTLSTDDLYALTTVGVSESFTSDRMWLNGKEEVITESKRLAQCLKQIRLRSDCQWKEYFVHICSENNFPTAAGLASSAAGYACLVYALGTLFGIEEKSELSILARMGSGSACRSIYGGFVQWVAGTDCNNSMARQIVDHNHWPEMRVIILVVNDREKETGSTVGMRLSVETSPLLKYRVAEVVPKRIEAITEAIQNKDFPKFAEITMRDSNEFHAICQDTWPPVRYMNDLSWDIIRLIQSYNEFKKTPKVAYTFDAGPNACLYLLQDVAPEVLALINKQFPPNSAAPDYVRGIKTPLVDLPQQLNTFISSQGNTVHPQALKYIISTKIGEGPQVLSEEIGLMNPKGLPK